MWRYQIAQYQQNGKYNRIQIVMQCCNRNPLQYSVLSEAYKSNSLSQIISNLGGLSDSPEVKGSICFNKQGRVHCKGSDSDVGFKISVNEVLGQVIITRKEQSNTFWRNLSDSKYQVEKGDTLKLGATLISVYDIYELGEHNQPRAEAKTTKREKERCRICFMDEESKTDPLLSFCKCTGSIKFMHLECYREWFIQKIRIYKENRITYFQFHNIRCDLCKETMPFSVAKNGTSYPILDYKKDYEVNDSHSYSMDAFREDDDLFNQPIYDMRQFSSDASVDSLFEPPEVRPQLQIVESPAKNQNGKCLVLKSQKTNNEGELTVEVILVKMVDEEAIYLGSDTSQCHIMMGSGSASPVHAKIFLKGSKVCVMDMNSAAGTFLELKQNKSTTFDSKAGLLLEHSGKQLLCLRKKPFVIPFLTLPEEYRVMLACDGTP